MDIFIKELNLVIEYDGSYWHKGKQKEDKKKSNYILNEGFDLIRLRQKPLKKIRSNDIIVDKPIKPKQTVIEIYKSIMANYTISKYRINKINRYIKSDGLSNYDKAEAYIKKLIISKYEQK